MKTIIKLFSLVFLTLVVVGSLFAVVIKDRPTAYNVNGEIVIRWSTADESSVQMFEILRAEVRSGQVGEFSKIGSIEQGKLKGNNSTYEFVDNSAFKALDRIFAYKIRVYFRQGTTEDSEIVRTSVLSSTAKSTWGSIKAMFR